MADSSPYNVSIITHDAQNTFDLLHQMNYSTDGLEPSSLPMRPHLPDYAGSVGGIEIADEGLPAIIRLYGEGRYRADDLIGSFVQIPADCHLYGRNPLDLVLAMNNLYDFCRTHPKTQPWEDFAGNQITWAVLSQALQVDLVIDDGGDEWVTLTAIKDGHVSKLLDDTFCEPLLNESTESDQQRTDVNRALWDVRNALRDKAIDQLRRGIAPRLSGRDRSDMANAVIRADEYSSEHGGFEY
jgi:hypothetical protein